MNRDPRKGSIIAGVGRRRRRRTQLTAAAGFADRHDGTSDEGQPHAQTGLGVSSPQAPGTEPDPTAPIVSKDSPAHSSSGPPRHHADPSDSVVSAPSSGSPSQTAPGRTRSRELARGGWQMLIERAQASRSRAVARRRVEAYLDNIVARELALLQQPNDLAENRTASLSEDEHAQPNAPPAPDPRPSGQPGPAQPASPGRGPTPPSPARTWRALAARNPRTRPRPESRGVDSGPGETWLASDSKPVRQEASPAPPEAKSRIRWPREREEGAASPAPVSVSATAPARDHDELELISRPPSEASVSAVAPKSADRDKRRRWRKLRLESDDGEGRELGAESGAGDDPSMSGSPTSENRPPADPWVSGFAVGGDRPSAEPEPSGDPWLDGFASGEDRPSPGPEPSDDPWVGGFAASEDRPTPEPEREPKPSDDPWVGGFGAGGRPPPIHAPAGRTSGWPSTGASETSQGGATSGRGPDHD